MKKSLLGVPVLALTFLGGAWLFGCASADQDQDEDLGTGASALEGELPWKEIGNAPIATGYKSDFAVPTSSGTTTPLPWASAASATVYSSSNPPPKPPQKDAGPSDAAPDVHILDQKPVK